MKFLKVTPPHLPFAKGEGQRCSPQKCRKNLNFRHYATYCQGIHCLRIKFLSPPFPLFFSHIPLYPAPQKAPPAQSSQPRISGGAGFTYPQNKKPSCLRIYPSAARPSFDKLRTRRFPSPFHKGFSFIGKTIFAWINSTKLFQLSRKLCLLQQFSVKTSGDCFRIKPFAMTHYENFIRHCERSEAISRVFKFTENCWRLRTKQLRFYQVL